MNSSNALKVSYVLSGILAAVLLVTYTAVVHAAGPWYVAATTGNNANDCLSPATACKTIQAAIGKASAGDTVNVAAGIYAEHVSINKALTLNGANSAVACRAARSTESVITGDSTGAVQILADNVTINGFQVSSTNNALGSGIWMDASKMNDTVKNNLVSQNQIGIYANSVGASVINCNIFDGNNEPGASGGAGIYSEFTDHLTIDNNEFKNHLTNNPVIFGATGAEVHKNLTFSNNLIHDNACGCSAVYALALKDAAFTGNDITSDSKDLYFDDGDHGVAITKNILHSTHGVYVHDGGYSGIGGLNTSIVANRNSLTGHSAFGIQNDGGQTANVDGTCNWWGNASGPSGVGPGTGDPVSAGVTFLSWLTTSDLTNDPCNGGAPPPTPAPPPANACSSQTPPPGYTLQNGTGGNDAVTLAPNTMFRGNGGNDKVTGGDGNFIVCTGGGNDLITLGNGDSTIDAGSGNNAVTVGNGTGSITTGGGNDSITTGNGAHTINAGSGNNIVKTGNGDQNVTTGGGNDDVTTDSGNDTINAGSGNNTVKSGAGNDSITTGGGNDSIDAGAGIDNCSPGGGINTVTNCSP